VHERVDGAVPDAQVVGGKWIGNEQRRVVHKNVDRVEALHRFVHHCSNRVVVVDARSNRKCLDTESFGLGSSFGGLGSRVVVVDDDVGTCTSKCKGDATSDSLRTTRDQRGLSLDIH